MIRTSLARSDRCCEAGRSVGGATGDGKLVAIQPVPKLDRICVHCPSSRSFSTRVVAEEDLLIAVLLDPFANLVECVEDHIYIGPVGGARDNQGHAC